MELAETTATLAGGVEQGVRAGVGGVGARGYEHGVENMKCAALCSYLNLNRSRCSLTSLAVSCWLVALFRAAAC